MVVSGVVCVGTTVGGHRLGGVFLIQTWPPFWGRPLGGSKRGSVPPSQQLNLQRCVSLTSMAVSVCSSRRAIPDTDSDGFWWRWRQQVVAGIGVRGQG